jgi:hypothetical protein
LHRNSARRGRRRSARADSRIPAGGCAGRCRKSALRTNRSWLRGRARRRRGNAPRRRRRRASDRSYQLLELRQSAQARSVWIARCRGRWSRACRDRARAALRFRQRKPLQRIRRRLGGPGVGDRRMHRCVERHRTERNAGSKGGGVGAPVDRQSGACGRRIRTRGVARYRGESARHFVLGGKRWRRNRSRCDRTRRFALLPRR